MKTKALLFGAGVVLVVGVAVLAFVQFQRAAARRAVIAAGVPSHPDLTGWAPDFVHRLDAAEARVAAGDDAPGALGELSRLYHANGFHPEAAQCYDALMALDPDEPRWPHRLAHILAGFGRVEDAIPLWRRTVKLAPDYLPARIRLGDALFKANQFDEAGEIYAGVLKDDPRSAYAILGLARLDVQAGRWEQARQRLEPLVQMTDFVLGYDLLPTVYEKLGDPDRAAAIRGREKASGAYRDMIDPWLDDLFRDCYDIYRLSLVGGSIARNGDNRTAITLLERALELDPDSAPVHYQIGLLFLGQKEFSRARPHLERCTELQPDFPDGWAQLAFLQISVGDGAAGDRSIDRGLALCPESAGLRIDRARRRAAVGRIDDAITDLRDAIRLRPQEAAAYVDLAQLLIRLGRVDEGVAELHNAQKAEPEYPRTLSLLAMHAISVGDEQGASQWMEHVRLQPRVPQAERDTLKRAFAEKFGKPAP